MTDDPEVTEGPGFAAVDAEAQAAAEVEVEHNYSADGVTYDPDPEPTETGIPRNDPVPDDPEPDNEASPADMLDGHDTPPGMVLNPRRAHDPFASHYIPESPHA